MSAGVMFLASLLRVRNFDGAAHLRACALHFIRTISGTRGSLGKPGIAYEAYRVRRY